MDAKELTLRYYELSQRIQELEKTVGYLTDDNNRLNVNVSDLSIDVKMIQDDIDRRKGYK